MELDLASLSFFLTLLSGIGAALGIIWWIRRIWWQKYSRRADLQDEKLNGLNHQLKILVSAQQHTDTVIMLMAESIDDIRDAMGKPRRFTPQQLLPLLNPVTKDEIQRVQLLKEIQDLLFSVNKVLEKKE